MVGLRVAALAALVALAGCVQVEVPQAATPVAPAPAADPNSFSVTCRLLGEEQKPITDGQCVYRFGNLGATAAVDDNGTAVRRVPAGASGSVSGSAPGRLSVGTDLVVDHNKVIRITLPLQKDGATAPQPQTEADSSSSTSGEEDEVTNQTQEAEPWQDAVVYTESRRDVLLEEMYVLTPVMAPTAVSSFVVADVYDTLEVSGKYTGIFCEYAALLQVSVKDPDGKEVASFDALHACLYPVGYGPAGSSENEFPLGFAYDPKPGTYTVSVTGAGAPPFTLSAIGMVGAAPDFTFRDIDRGAGARLSDHFGKVLIIDLMATWCGPCQDAMAGFRAIRDEYNGAVDVLSIDIDSEETDTQLRAFSHEFKANWTFGFDDDSEARLAYGTEFIPTVAVIDQHGGLLYRSIGEIPEDKLRELIDYALENR